MSTSGIFGRRSDRRRSQSSPTASVRASRSAQPRKNPLPRRVEHRRYARAGTGSLAIVNDQPVLSVTDVANDSGDLIFTLFRQGNVADEQERRRSSSATCASGLAGGDQARLPIYEPPQAPPPRPLNRRPASFRRLRAAGSRRLVVVADALSQAGPLQPRTCPTAREPDQACRRRPAHERHGQMHGDGVDCPDWASGIGPHARGWRGPHRRASDQPAGARGHPDRHPRRFWQPAKFVPGHHSPAQGRAELARFGEGRRTSLVTRTDLTGLLSGRGVEFLPRCVLRAKTSG